MDPGDAAGETRWRRRRVRRVGVGELAVWRSQSAPRRSRPRSPVASRSSNSTARRVHTAHWPSSPPTIRRSTFRPPVWNRNGVTRSGMMKSSLPVYSAIAAARVGHRAHHVQRLVAIERRDLDRDDVLDLGQPPPEREPQHPSADRRLEVEPDDRDHLGHPAAVGDDRVIARSRHAPRLSSPRGSRSQAPVSASATACRVWPQTPAIRTNGARAARAQPVAVSAASRGRARQDVRVADGELRRVHADGHPAGAGVDVVPGQRPLPALVEPARSSSASGCAGITSPSSRCRGAPRVLSEPSVPDFKRGRFTETPPPISIHAPPRHQFSRDTSAGRAA